MIRRFVNKLKSKTKKKKKKEKKERSEASTFLVVVTVSHTIHKLTQWHHTAERVTQEEKVRACEEGYVGLAAYTKSSQPVLDLFQTLNTSQYFKLNKTVYFAKDKIFQNFKLLLDFVKCYLLSYSVSSISFNVLFLYTHFSLQSLHKHISTPFLHMEIT